MAHIFLSYKKADRDRVSRLAQDLIDEGFTVWWDYDIDAGNAWFERILDEVRNANCLVGCWTSNAVNEKGVFTASSADGHNYVELEHNRAGRGKVAGALLDTGCVPAAYENFQHSDLTTWTPGDRQHPGFRDLVKRATQLATPAFAHRALADAEAEKRLATEQLSAARVRGDTLQTQLNEKLQEFADITERKEQELRAQGALLAAAEANAKNARAQLETLQADVDRRGRQAIAARGLRVGGVAALVVACLAIGGGAMWFGKQPVENWWAQLTQSPTPTRTPVVLATEPAATEAPLLLSNDAGALPHGAMFKDCGDCPEMVVLEGDRFDMGAEGENSLERIWDSIDRVAFPENEFEPRRVIVPSFAIGRFEVTYAQYNACDNCSPAPRAARANPIASVTWAQAEQYVLWLSDYTGQHYYLPREVEWEFAARGGLEGVAFGYGDDPNVLCRYANFSAQDTPESSANNPRLFVPPCSDGFPNSVAPVGSFLPNGWGLFDMHGNVWEWVDDCYAEYGESEDTLRLPLPEPLTEPRNSEDASCTLRVTRGGSFDRSPQHVRSASRNPRTATSGSPQIGFRVARVLSSVATP